MPTLTYDPARVEAEFGFRPLERLLFSAIRLDSHPFVTPLIWDDGDTTLLLVRQQEQGNVLSAGVSPDRLRFYEPWVTIDPRPVADYPAAVSLPALVRELADGRAVDLSNTAPYTHHLSLTGEVEVRTGAPSPTPVTVFEVDESAVLERFAAWRRAGVPVAAAVIAATEQLAGLEAELGAETDTRFTGLAELAEVLEVGAVLLSSPPNTSEVTGVAGRDGVRALWVPGSGRVLLIADRDLRGVPGRAVGRFDDAAQAVASLLEGEGAQRLAFEEQWERTSLALQLVEHGIALVPASRPLGTWRDLRDAQDLAFQVLAARASTTAIQATVAYGHEQLDAGRELTENALYAFYLDRLDAFRAEHAIPFGIEPYFTNLHSSQRMLFPGPPTDFPVDASTTCVQLDAGVRITIEGVTLATSDMARSLLRTPEGAEAYELLGTAVREGIIERLRPGLICEDVHATTLEHLRTVRPRMIELGLLGEETDFETEYRKRNVGHLMGKQESFANELRPGYRGELTVGSYGAAEIPWRYGVHAIGYEDLWYIGADRTYNLTR